MSQNEVHALDLAFTRRSLLADGHFLSGNVKVLSELILDVSALARA